MNFLKSISSISSRSLNIFTNISKTIVDNQHIRKGLTVRTPLNSRIDLKSTQFSRNNFTKYFNILPKTSTTTLLKTREIHDASMAKKRTGLRRRRNEQYDELTKSGYFPVTAYATAEEYDLEKIVDALKTQNLYETKKLFFSNEDDMSDTEPNVIFATAKYQVENEQRGMFLFREGTIVMWNFSEMEISNVLNFLKLYEHDGYGENIVQSESEIMFYNYTKDKTAQLKNNNFYITKLDEKNLFEKYTFSNALSLSVKLGIWEATLNHYVDSMGYLTEDLKQGRKIKTTRAEMLRKTGELFALRHLINLSSDLLDTPDFYWDREELERLYSATTNYFSISKRTRVMNEKLNHCVELADLISSNLHEDLNVRLEKIIIYLIMIEVMFECIHYAERYFG
jgi:required for meiotic nuclear division protein 1